MLPEPQRGQAPLRRAPQAMQWRRYDAGRQRLMQAELERMLATPGISRGLHELLVNALGDAAGSESREEAAEET